MSTSPVWPGGLTPEGQISDGETLATRSDSPQLRPRDVSSTEAEYSTMSQGGCPWIPVVEQHRTFRRGNCHRVPSYSHTAPYRARRHTHRHAARNLQNSFGVQPHYRSHDDTATTQELSTFVLSIAAELDEDDAHTFPRRNAATPHLHARSQAHAASATAERQRFRDAFRNIWRQRWPLGRRQSDPEVVENIIRHLRNGRLDTPPLCGRARRRRRTSVQRIRQRATTSSTTRTAASAPPSAPLPAVVRRRSGAISPTRTAFHIPHGNGMTQPTFLLNAEPRGSGGSESQLSSMATEACSYPFATEPTDEPLPHSPIAAQAIPNNTFPLDLCHSSNERISSDRLDRPYSGHASAAAPLPPVEQAASKFESHIKRHEQNNQSNVRSTPVVAASSRKPRVLKYRRTEAGNPQNRAPADSSLPHKGIEQCGGTSSDNSSSTTERGSAETGQTLNAVSVSTTASEISHSKRTTNQNGVRCSQSSCSLEYCNLTTEAARVTSPPWATLVPTRPGLQFSREPLPTELILWELQNCFRNVRDLVTCMRPVCRCPAIDWLPKDPGYRSSGSENAVPPDKRDSGTLQMRTKKDTSSVCSHDESGEHHPSSDDMREWVTAMNYINSPSVNLIEEDMHLWTRAPFGDALTQLFSSLLERYPLGSRYSYIAGLDHLADIPLRFGNLRTDVTAQHYMLFAIMSMFDHFKDPAVLPPQGSEEKVKFHEILPLMRKIMSRILVIYAHVFSAHGRIFKSGRERKSLLDCFQYFLRVAMGYSILSPGEIFLPRSS